MNYDGAFQLRVSAAAGDSLLDHIERLIEGASGEKARYQRLADRVSRLYAPVVYLTALVTALGWWFAGATVHDAVITGIAVLIITCPCALALALPAVQVVAAGALFKSGVLLNSGDAVERMAQVDMVVFDKTGTLTLPQASVVNAQEIDPALFQQAARLALSSHHPLAKALGNTAIQGGPFDGARERPGAGVIAVIDGVEATLGAPAFCKLEREALLAQEKDKFASVIAFRRGDQGAVFLVRQALRADAGATISALRKRGLDVMILSGDRSAAVESAARVLGVDHWRAEMKPDEKIAFLQRVQVRGHKALMVGDGVNDAPALAAAHVSMSPITGAEITQASADAVFLGESLAPVLQATRISKNAHNIMVQNLSLAVVYNLVAVPLAISGLVTPLVAALAMSGSSILVTLNALRARWLRSAAEAAS